MILLNDNLLDQLKKKDKKAWGIIYKEYKPMIIKLVLKNSGDLKEAEDLVQNVMISLYENLENDKIRVDSHLRNYIYTLALNQWRSNLKKFKKNDFVEIDDSMIIMEDEEDILEEMDYNEKLEVIIDSLKDNCKKLMKYRYSSLRKTMDEIAVICGFSNARSAISQLNKCMNSAKELAMTL